MNRSACLAAATCIAAAASSSALGDFAVGNQVVIQGVAGPQNGYTYWGTNVDGQTHGLGTSDQVYLDSFAPTYFVSVTSWVNSPTSVTFSFDFSNYNAGQYSVHALEIIGLKNDHSLSSVTASQGAAWVQDGNKIRWDGLGAALADEPKLLLTIEQVPAPGVLATLALAGLSRTGRRRS